MGVEERQATHFWSVPAQKYQGDSFLLQISAKDKSVHVEDSSLVLYLDSWLDVTVLQVSLIVMLWQSSFLLAPPLPPFLLSQNKT